MKKYIITIATVTLVVLILALGGYYYLTKDDKSTTPSQTTQKDNSKSSTTKENNKTNKNSEDTPSTNGKTPETVTQPTVINGIVLANKKHPLPANYNPGENPTARQKVNKLISDAQAL